MSTLYNGNCRDTQTIAATIFTVAFTKKKLNLLDSLRDSSGISINFRRALILGIDKLNDFISYLIAVLQFETQKDLDKADYVKNMIINSNFKRLIFGEDKTVIIKMLICCLDKSNITNTSINSSVNSTISSSLNSTDPITKIAISFTFTSSESNYKKAGYAFNNVSYYGSKTTFTLNSSNYITIKSDGDPFPALAGNPIFTNDYINNVARTFEDIPEPMVEQNYNYTFAYRGGTNTSNPESFFDQIGEGVQGIFANGNAVYSPSAGTTVAGTNISGTNKDGVDYYLNAIFFEAEYYIDQAGGHPSPEGNIVNGDQGQYHYHDGMFIFTAWNNTTFYNSNSYFSGTNYDGDYIRNTDGHSKIVGICFDGYPIYGVYGYSSAQDSTSEVILMVSGYTLNDSPFAGRPYGYDDYGYTDDGTPIQISAGSFLDDYYYDSTVGATLDLYNGRYCVTPDYPNGTYAYFITVDENLDPVFPYIIGSSTKQQRTVINNGYVG